MTSLRFVALVLVSAALAGCSAFQSMDHVRGSADDYQTVGKRHLDRFRELTADSHRAQSQVVPAPWVAGRAQPLAREVTLPPALRANVNTTLLFDDRDVGLVTLAERIQMATGIPVHVEPDALLPRDAFLPRIEGSPPQSIALMPASMNTLVPALSPNPASIQLAGPTLPHGVSRTKTGPFAPGQAPLAAVLDATALRLGVYWRYDSDVGAIRFYRTQTRVFNVRALTAQAEATLDQPISTFGLAAGGQSQSSSQDRSAKQLQAALAKVEQFLTRAGVARAADGGANTIVVTDTQDVLDRLSAFLDTENRAMTRRVRLVFEEVTVQRDHVTQAGVDWHILFNSLGRANLATGSGVGTLLDGAKAASSIGATVGSGPWSGSGAILNALSEIGAVVRHTSIPMLALNRRAAKYAVRETFSYVKDLQQTQSLSDSSAPTVTVTQDEKTVGTFLTVVPDAHEDGQVLLTVAYDDTRLIGALKKEEFGSPDYPSFVQQHRIGGQGVIQQVELRPGQPAVIGGYEQSSGNATRRRLDDRAPMLLGGSDATQQQQLLTVLIVTAIPEEGF